MIKKLLKIIIAIFFIIKSSYVLAQSNDELFHAIDNNQPNIVTDLIKNGISIDQKTKYGITPLMRAIISNNENIVRLLIDYGANPDSTDLAGATPLHFAARANNINIIKILIDQKINIDPKDNECWTPLMRAVISRNYGNTELLIDNNADPFIENDYDQSALHKAIIIGDVKLINLLIKKDHDVNFIQRDSLIKLAKSKNKNISDIVENYFISVDNRFQKADL